MDNMVAASDLGMNGEERYGILIYDVPMENQKLYHHLRTRISKRAIRMNLSVYLLKWGMKEQIQTLIDEAFEKTGQHGTVCMMPFDMACREDIERIAKESLIREIQDIGVRLQKHVAKKLEEDEEVPDRYYTQAKNRLENAQGLAMLFGLTGDVEYVMSAAKELFNMELEQRRVRSGYETKTKAFGEDTGSEDEAEPTPEPEAEDQVDTETDDSESVVEMPDFDTLLAMGAQGA